MHGRESPQISPDSAGRLRQGAAKVLGTIEEDQEVPIFTKIWPGSEEEADSGRREQGGREGCIEGDGEGFLVGRNPQLGEEIERGAPPLKGREICPTMRRAGLEPWIRAYRRIGRSWRFLPCPGGDRPICHGRRRYRTVVHVAHIRVWTVAAALPIPSRPFPPAWGDFIWSGFRENLGRMIRAFGVRVTLASYPFSEEINFQKKKKKSTTERTRPGEAVMWN